MVRYFDPRKLIVDQQEEEKKKVEDVLLTQERLDLFKEKEAAALRKKSNIREGLKAADRTVREFKFLKEDEDAYYDWKIKQDPDFRDPREYTDDENEDYYRQEIESMRGMLEGATIDWKTGETIWPDGKKEKQLKENMVR